MKQLVFAIALVFSAAPALAQTGDDAFRFAQRTPLSSPELIGSAGVGAAGRGDLGDLFGNPAGLGWMKRGAFSISLNSSSAESEAVYSLPGLSSARTSDLADSQLGGLAYLYKAPTTQGSLVFGAGVSQVASFNRVLSFEGENGLNSFTDFLMPLSNEFELVDDNGDVFPEFSRTLSFIGYETFAIDLNQAAAQAGDPVPFDPAVSFGTVLQTGRVEETGQQSEFTIGGGWEASEDVMVGLSLNVPFGKYEFNRVLDEDDIFDENNGADGTTDFSYLTFTEGFESRMVGLNLRAGLSAKVSSNLRVGAVLETPTWYTVQEDYDTALFTAFDNGDQFEYGDDFDEDAGRGSFDYNVRTPWKLGVGLTYTAGKLDLSGDLELVDWSQLELDSGSFSFADQNQAIRENFESVANIRLGAQYRMDKVHLRAGLAGITDPRTNNDSVDRDRGLVSLGVSYLINDQFALDLAFMGEAFGDRYAPYTEVADAPIVNEDVTRGFVTLGVRVGL
ncbi:MAG: outer membrane protein transport protein [Rhodothermales bacterium]|nr:outer membrane protein transport protein [Rhodothermales bacterium]MBO6780367.1 outer membrane protein transport protein [Rhodothermales bacterium]